MAFIPLFLSPLRSFAVDPLALDIAVQGIATAQPPVLLSDVVLLSYKSEDFFPRFVGARFENEGYAVLHPYSLNQNEVYVLDFPIPEGLSTLRYRIVVDGLWMRDPANPWTETDVFGNEISVFAPGEPRRSLLNPRVEKDGTITMIYRGPEGRQVFLAGDFNDWDPFTERFEEASPGLYRANLRVKPGDHFYFFFVDGVRILDPQNPSSAFDPDGNLVSAFSLP
jgi:hypothetical protein